MEAGRELDAKIGIVLGWELRGEGGPYEGFWVSPDGNMGDGLPHYSTSIADAWTVIGKMRADGYTVDLIDERNPRIWCCEMETDEELHAHFARADTAPHAICLAALEAVK